MTKGAYKVNKDAGKDLVQFWIDSNENKVVEALKPIFKTRARSKVYRKAAALAYQNFKSAGQIKEATK